MKYNIWNKWDPLKVCMLGNNYAPEFFDGIPDKAGDPLKRICEETLEDLEGFKEILQQFGVQVLQPDMNKHERFLDNPSRYPRGPLQPRDHQLVIGNVCLSNNEDHFQIVKKLNEYEEVTPYAPEFPYIGTEQHYNQIKGADYPSYQDFLNNRFNKNYFEDFIWQELLSYSHVPLLSSATAFTVGTKLIIGGIQGHSLPDCQDYNHVPALCDFNIQISTMDGHIDGNYHPLKPGVILSLHDVQNYNETFPGWDVCYLPDQSWNKVKGFLQLKDKNQGKWWLAGEEANDEFTYFVETWLQDWVGYVEETVFDVNVLVLDEHHVCISNTNNDQANQYFKKHNIEPVYVPWRHRYFWDGGLHCITLDLVREGVQKNYF